MKLMISKLIWVVLILSEVGNAQPQPCQESAFTQVFGDNNAVAFKDISDVVIDYKL